MKQSAAVILAKAPVAGLAKTRLIDALGQVGAAKVAEKCLQTVVPAVMHAGFDYVELCVTPDAGHDVFQQLLRQYDGLHLSLQIQGDLGARMAAIFQRLLPTFDQVFLLGSDVPHFTPTIFQQARAALTGHDVVLVPALDGGYVLIGLATMLDELFMAMTWSQPQVLEQTVLRIKQAHKRYRLMPPLADIDCPEDLIHLPQDWCL